MILYATRHGLATYSKTGYGKDVFSAMLLPEGIATTKKMAEYLKNVETDVNARSAFIRCEQTATIITEITTKEFVVDARLNEFQPSFDPNPYLVEKFDSFKARIFSFVNELKEKKYNTVFVCTHGSVVGALKAILQRNSLEENDLRWYPQTGVLVKLTENTTEEINFN